MGSRVRALPLDSRDARRRIAYGLMGVSADLLSSSMNEASIQ